jgi:NCAIR mutase (PurE)-related protein
MVINGNLKIKIMEIKIEDYLSEEEIKEIVKEEIRKHVRNCVGEVSVSQDKARVMLSVMAKQIARDGIQGLIPNFKEYLDEHIKEEIKKIQLHDFFTHNMGWRSDGNKLINSILSDNKQLIDAKIKEIFKLHETK